MANKSTEKWSNERELEEWARECETHHCVGLQWLQRVMGPATADVRRRVEHWMKRELRHVPAPVRRKLQLYLCRSSWSQRRIKEVWRVLAQHRTRLQRLLTVTERCLAGLPDVDPATREIFEVSAEQLNRTVEMITSRLPISHREWVLSGRRMFEPGAQGPNTTSYWAEPRKRTQAAFSACVDLLHENGTALPRSIELAFQALRVANLEGVSDVDPNYVGLYRQPDLKRSNANFSFGEPRHFHERGKGGRNRARRNTTGLSAAFELELRRQWPALVSDRRRRSEVARRIVGNIAEAVKRRGHRFTQDQRSLLQAGLEHPSSTPHSIAVRCVAWIEGRSLAAVRKAAATKRVA